ncbi:FAD-dependent monooxygenase [Prescottella agglutinans]|uniref:Polyketide hydroxylase n=1 Tax=Prescottella agglutinans TaxID=1644129 RepID=A0ABT6MFL7_9NOCA|nr:FAD-dependent monooxygenase [Prescottella agglutinans]MDH6283107.1 putative polyketide hydroxylase [Prescottella agglutinans]
MDAEHVPVLIVGAGAGGLATSALLVKHGVRSLLVEKRREIFIYPKARNLSFRTLEILRGLGLADEVHAVAEGVSDMVVKPALNSPVQKPALGVAEIFAQFDELSPEPSAQYFPQSKLEPVLLAYTRGHGSEVRYGTSLSSFEQDDTGVTAVLRDLDSGTERTVRADYLVAADGVHSSIRDTLGVATAGYGPIPIFVVFVYFRAPWRRLVPGLGDGDGVQVENADVDGIFLVAQGDLGMFVTTYFPGEGETAEQFTAQRCHGMLLAAIGEPMEVQIVDVAPWQPHEQVAAQFECGRIFLVGDAAHTMPPFKAGGANAAIQSAHNLAWKLSAVLDGTAEPGLLATYRAERHPIGRFSARQSLTGPAMKFLRLDDDRPQLPAGEERPLFDMLIGYRYWSAAVVTDEPAPEDPDAVSLVEELRAQPGTRVPHVWVRRDGERVSTLDLLGPGFTLLTADAGARWAVAAASASSDLGVPIAVHHIGAGGDAVDTDGAWAAVTGLAPSGALLIRPDDFVGWRADEMPVDPADALGRALSAILARDRPEEPGRPARRS